VDADFTLTEVLSMGFSAGQAGHLAEHDRLQPLGTPSGGYAQVTANQTTITALVDLSGLTVHCHGGVGRRIRITGYVLLSTTVSGDTFSVAIREGSTTLQVAQLTTTFHRTRPRPCTRPWCSPLSGTSTPTSCRRHVSARHRDVQRRRDFPAFILAEDIGT